ncbi:hypothetical protein QTP86_023058 [Hemibagrus guttatus]|nr:hypothetical protein QTP86_023058 [Hemibagrus guttatus]
MMYAVASLIIRTWSSEASHDSTRNFTLREHGTLLFLVSKGSKRHTLNVSKELKPRIVVSVMKRRIGYANQQDVNLLNHLITSPHTSIPFSLHHFTFRKHGLQHIIGVGPPFAAKTALTLRGMDSTGSLKVCCGIWHQDVRSRSFKSCK